MSNLIRHARMETCQLPHMDCKCKPGYCMLLGRKFRMLEPDLRKVGITKGKNQSLNHDLQPKHATDDGKMSFCGRPLNLEWEARQGVVECKSCLKVIEKTKRDKL